MEKEVWGRYRERGLVVVGIDTSEQGDAQKLARQFISENGVTYPAVLDTEGDVSEAYHVQALPTIAIIDGKGVLKYIQAGFDEEAVVKTVESLLALK